MNCNKSFKRSYLTQLGITMMHEAGYTLKEAQALIRRGMRMRTSEVIAMGASLRQLIAGSKAGGE